ncbi:MAG: D-hexose-6-phosphate mutarotase [Methylococcales bacterium]|nr:D-hexose-6-phosphate mutarotase [Methylococcales bacterium]
MRIEHLNRDHGIKDHLKFTKGNGHLPFIFINNARASAIISLHGAQILSFKPHREEEDLLFVSQNSWYEEGRAIRGGIPLCWPWFGPDPSENKRPDHGFVRNGLWDILRTEAVSKHETKIVFRFETSEKSAAYWQQPFSLELEVIISDTLTVNLITRNTGDEAFTITQALHAYFNVGHINEIKILGLDNSAYLDKAQNEEEYQQEGNLTINAEVNRIYKDVENPLVIQDDAFNRKIVITATHHKTAVVWNPGVDLPPTITDLETDDYQRFVCVESGNVSCDTIEIPPHSEFILRANYKITKNK